MDWTAPELLASLGFVAAVLLWYTAMMIVTGRRYRGAVRGRAHTGVGTVPSALSHEELGLLADGERRWAEVALLRLCLEGHVEEDGLIVLVDDPGAATEPARRALLDRLRGRRPAHLMDVLHAGRRGDSSDAFRRLVALGLVDERAARIAATRERVVGAFAALLTLGLIVLAVGGALAMPPTPGTRDKVELIILALAVFAVSMIVAGTASRRTGGRLEASTPEGRELLARAEREAPRSADDRLLRRVALHGLLTVPEFASAAERGPTAGQTTGRRGFSVFAEMVAAIGGIFGGGQNSGGGQGK